MSMNAIKARALFRTIACYLCTVEGTVSPVDNRHDWRVCAVVASLIRCSDVCFVLAHNGGWRSRRVEWSNDDVDDDDIDSEDQRLIDVLNWIEFCGPDPVQRASS
jgi:hypothetical protein